MKKGLFLPLDSYMENAQHMEFDKLDQKVMEAGRNEQGQLILLMFYRLDEVVLRQEAESFPTSWGEAAAMAEEDESMLETFCRGLQWTGFREMCFGQIVDALSEELLISQDEFFQCCKEALDLYQRAAPRLKELDALSYQSYNGFVEESRAYMSDWCGYAGAADGSFSSFVFRNKEGEINAPIETWCAVNSNTKHP